MKSLIITLLLSLFFSASYSQNEIKISYNQSIQLKNVKNDTDFHISSAKGKVHVKGTKINEYVFTTPGTYTIKIKEHTKSKASVCEHESTPKEITVIVSRVKMTFDGNNIAFSEPIHKNIETSRITFRIPVKIETYDKKPVVLDFSPVNTAGVGTNIVATLDRSANTLNDGVHILKYSLHGIVTENSFLMFDFIDANSAIQSVALTTPIKD